MSAVTVMFRVGCYGINEAVADAATVLHWCHLARTQNNTMNTLPQRHGDTTVRWFAWTIF